jgi:uncharacterized alkaline shock family protein YloU
VPLDRPAIVLAGVVADAVARVDGVVALHGGPAGEFATYGGGRKVSGVRLRRGGRPHVEVRVVARFGVHLPTLAEQVRTAVASALDTAAPTVTVCISDLAAATPAEPGGGADATP